MPMKIMDLSMRDRRERIKACYACGLIASLSLEEGLKVSTYRDEIAIFSPF